MPYFDFAVIEGDRRNAYLIACLREQGFRVCAFHVPEEEDRERKAAHKAFRLENFEETVKSAKTVIAGMPLKRFMRDYPKYMNCDQTFYAGGITQDLRQAFQAKGIPFVDLLEVESIRQYNSAATAEGVVLELLKREERLFVQLRFLVLGYGRCGQMIADRVRGMHGDVYVFTIDQIEKGKAESMGFSCVNSLETETYDIVINTVPNADFITNGKLGALRKRVLHADDAEKVHFYDIAGTVEAGDLIYLSSLPGKYAAQGMAKVIAQYAADRKAAGSPLGH